MGRDRCISGRSSEILSVFVGDVLALTVLVALGEAEVDDVDVVSGRISASDQEVIRFDITMDNSLFVHFFNTSDELNSDHQNCLQIKVTFATLEQILQRRSQQVHHHHVELLIRHRAIRSDVVKTGYTGYSQKRG